MKLVLRPQDITRPNGLEIAIEGFTPDPGNAKPAQVFMEVHEGKLWVHIWADQSPDPAVVVQVPPPL
jgi:hypothetical protein